MQLRNIIFAAGAAALLVFLAALAALVQRTGKVAIDPAALARARARHQREAARREPVVVPAPNPFIPPPRARAVRANAPRPTLAPPRVAAADPRFRAGAGAPSRRRRGAFNAFRPTTPLRAFQKHRSRARSLKARMAVANHLYDRRMFSRSQAAALRILATHPDNVRMLRIVVSTACIMGQRDLAPKYNARLPASDQEEMRRRCSRYGVDL